MGLKPVFVPQETDSIVPAATRDAVHGMRRTVAANAEIFAEGDRATTFHKVVSGVVRTDKLLSDGRRQNFGWATDHLLALAERVCGGRLVSVLEGGYDLGGLSRGVQVHVAALLEAGSVRTRGLSEDAPDLSDPYRMDGSGPFQAPTPVASLDGRAGLYRAPASSDLEPPRSGPAVTAIPVLVRRQAHRPEPGLLRGTRPLTERAAPPTA
ncbi:hypothetical protein ASG63_12280 [Methylobacterium sp. Leaf94]|uniref:hypothetical protein n=1 Tax=Methylobacterium sp. Leaf94 TaxID=1736250 RepID=UPI0006F54888|nr:hypothetical protein [Methylobacterium sp. Leaf94]KQU16149.1 hypothetical protein ASG63_12280 [Methylobacterium sp. Leaf94]